MAYNINKSNGTPVTVPTGAIDNQFDIPLIGQDAINYGDDLALAFVRLLENFASSTEPAFGSARTTGQLWYDTQGLGQLKIYDGSAFVVIPKDSTVVHVSGNETITGTKTFNGRPAFNGGTTGVDSPFTVDSTFVVTNLNADQLDGLHAASFALAADVIGKTTMYIPANKMYPTVTNGCAALSTVELTAGRPNINVLAFDQTTVENAQFSIAFPKSWDEGTVTFQVFWTANDASTNGVSWGLQGVAMGDGETIDAVFGTAVVVDDANQGTNNDLLVSAESTAVTIGGTPGEDNMVFFQIYRDTNDSNDNMSADARLVGIKLFFTTDAPTDA